MSGGLRFEPLVRCDVAGCPNLVEPHVGRCGDCRRELGPLHPEARPGVAPPPAAAASPPEGPAPPEASADGFGVLVRCAGLRGRPCAALVAPPARRCGRCRAELRRRLREAGAAGAGRRRRRSRRQPQPNKRRKK